MAKIKGQLIWGKFDDLIIRVKSDVIFDLGELLVIRSKNYSDVVQIFDVNYSSQISSQNIELASGLFLEKDSDYDFMESDLRNYIVAHSRILFRLENSVQKVPKSLPDFFSYVYELEEDDLSFLNSEKTDITLGKLRSGSKVLNINIGIAPEKLLSEHVLISASTGKGKSNLTSCILLDSVGKGSGFLVLDPHDEYYGRNSKGLKDHPLAKDFVKYYTFKDVPPGQNSLLINLSSIKPVHFNGSLVLSDPQSQLMYLYYKDFKEDWIKNLMLGVPLRSIKSDSFNEATLNVLKRKIQYLLGLSVYDDKLSSSGIFSLDSGKSVINDIISDLESGKIVIIDTSSLSGSAEIFIGSIITTEIFKKYKWYKMKGLLNEKPNISVVIEEAPRVLGKDVLESGSNIFETLAREGRKFKVGIFAITQLPSLIPKSILANLNTKIIMGMEMNNERQAIIESASHDLSKDNRTIASLDKGEAIVSSTFLKYPVPIKVSLFRDNLIKVISDNYESSDNSVNKERTFTF